MEGAQYRGSQPVSAGWGWLFPALWVGLILVASSIPDISTPRGFAARDKIIHISEYGVLAVLVAVALREGFRWRRSTCAWIAFAISLAVGALDEAYQCTVGGREADLWDFLADGVGAAVGQVFLLVGRVRGSRT